MLIDTHCHLNFEAFKDDLPKVINRAKERGVEKIIIPGTDLASSRHAVEIANQFDNCFAAIGIHPHHAKDPDLTINDKLQTQLSQLMTSDRVAAVGEIGLDYHVYSKSRKYDDVSITDEVKAKQKELFLMQFHLAQKHKLSTILHCREAHDDMIQTISSYAKASDDESTHSISRSGQRSLDEVGHPLPPGVFHCWGGSRQHLKLLITMGYYIGFDGNITYSDSWGNFVSSTPLSRLVLETDAPFLTPVPYRGSRNEPGYLPYVASAVAKYQGVSIEDVTRSTTENARKLFSL